MKPIKVLFVHGGTLKRAGTETFLMNTLRTIDATRVHIDFMVFGRTPGDFDQEVLDHGCKIYRIPYTPQDLKIKGPSIREIKKQIKYEDYDIVHAHMNALNSIVLKQMEKLGIKIRLSHSHASENIVESKIISKCFDCATKSIPKYATQLLACSHVAGEFLYGNRPFIVVNNGINVSQYAYNPNVRDAVRETYNLNGKFVVGHVGRFHFQKNHEFLIDVFQKLIKIQPNAHLVLVGEGELEPKIKQKVKALGLEGHVTYTGVLSSTERILQGFDIFVLPSLFEGLPYVLVEAQCSGLPCVVADTVSSESKLIEPFTFLPLKDPGMWADTIINFERVNRVSQAETLDQLGFNNKKTGQWLTDYYETLVNGGSDAENMRM
ncbi:hypothetical protein AOC36_07860 [Erysipelothrix larvae]|uniref:Glycosyl transferase family 1 domain-containing protein n=1 Tax=Erysipelothrix larvae TaxID=1514105 RepID=A0A109UH99_9FIRM|nr:glycosyltransferase family 1 protein [Erysipelothrix larvae]AMC93901.1 hypothetical protein AOC36_07860 [Erysipelothrix larvae]